MKNSAPLYSRRARDKCIYSLANEPFSEEQNRGLEKIREHLIVNLAGVDRFKNGCVGPPYDPIELAQYLKNRLLSSDDVEDARTTYRENQTIIEFNPSKPSGEIDAWAL